MVVFEDGKPKRSDYKRFRIKHQEGNNDFLSMQEVVRRRFTRALAATPGTERMGEAPPEPARSPRRPARTGPISRSSRTRTLGRPHPPAPSPLRWRGGAVA